LPYARRSGPLSREGSLSCHTCCFSGFIRRTTPFSRLLRHTRGCGESILTRILTCPHSVASYDTQRDVEDLFESGSSWVRVTWITRRVNECPDYIVCTCMISWRVVENSATFNDNLLNVDKKWKVPTNKDF
jgi:hypothetical protein